METCSLNRRRWKAIISQPVRAEEGSRGTSASPEWIPGNKNLGWHREKEGRKLKASVLIELGYEVIVHLSRPSAISYHFDRSTFLILVFPRNLKSLFSVFPHISQQMSDS